MRVYREKQRKNKLIKIKYSLCLKSLAFEQRKANWDRMKKRRKRLCNGEEKFYIFFFKRVVDDFIF